MKKIFASLLLLSITGQFVLAQLTQAEIDKMMKQSKEMMKKYIGDTGI